MSPFVPAALWRKLKYSLLSGITIKIHVPIRFQPSQRQIPGFPPVPDNSISFSLSLILVLLLLLLISLSLSLTRTLSLSRGSCVILILELSSPGIIMPHKYAIPSSLMSPPKNYPFHVYAARINVTQRETAKELLLSINHGGTRSPHLRLHIPRQLLHMKCSPQ